jgi:hypothetical protein
MRAFVVVVSAAFAVGLAAPDVRASSLGEVTAATGIHKGLAGGGAGSGKAAMGAVKRKLPGAQTAASGSRSRGGGAKGGGWLAGGMDGGKSSGGWVTNDVTSKGRGKRRR